MDWKNDRLKPSQPYFVLDTKNFYQEVYVRQGISHFYNYTTDGTTVLRSVPDGCIDLFFIYANGKMQGYVCGTRLGYTEQLPVDKGNVFGVRFMPGVCPELIQATMKTVLAKNIPLEDVRKGEQTWLEALENEEDFFQRIRIFLEHYTKVEHTKKKAYGKHALLLSVKAMVYQSEGKIKVSEMQEKTGYSERYINRVFIEEMGFSPKTFCKIIQFQKSLEYLNYGAPDKMTDAAVYLGYYDQSQFIHDFTKYAGITPKKYLHLVESADYRKKINSSRDKGV